METEYSVSATADPTLVAITSVIFFALIILVVIAMWKMFIKAGEHGWAAIVPFYNRFVEFKIAGFNGWMFLVLLVPVVNVVMAIILAIKLGERFGKSAAWSFFLLFLLAPIGYSILGFGQASYLPLPPVADPRYAAPSGYAPPPAPPAGNYPPAPPAGSYPPAPPAGNYPPTPPAGNVPPAPPAEQ
jgi:hypothetical protein